MFSFQSEHIHTKPVSDFCDEYKSHPNNAQCT